MAASSLPSGSAQGLSRSKSCWPSSTTKSLGTRTLPCPTTVFLSSVSRWSAPAISTGWTSPLNTLANAPSTKPPSRRSNRCRTPTEASLPFRGVIVSALRSGSSRWSRCYRWRPARASGGMADAHGSGPCVRKDVGVQLPPRPPFVADLSDRGHALACSAADRFAAEQRHQQGQRDDLYGDDHRGDRAAAGRVESAD